MANLKTKADLIAATRNIKAVKETLKAKYNSSRTKPAEYTADQEYVEIFKLGPVVDEILEAIGTIEEELADVVEYLGKAVGTDTNTVSVDGADVITKDETTGDVTVNADEIDLGDGTKITSDPDGGFSFNF